MTNQTKDSDDQSDPGEPGDRRNYRVGCRYKSGTLRNKSETSGDHKRLALVIAFAVGVAIATTSLASLSTLRSGRISFNTIGAPASMSDRLDAVLLVRDVDTARQEVRMRLYLDPVGNLADPSGRFAQKVIVDSSNEDVSGGFITEQGSATLITDFIATFDRGDDVSFPFDRYKTTIWLNAKRSNGSEIPISLKFEAADSTYRYETTDLSEDERSDVEPTFDLTVQRSGLTKTLAIIIIVLMWALGIAVGAVTWLVITRANWRQRSFEILGWLAAMLFALIQLRGVAPGAPGFGTLFDFVGFFWAELITAVSLCLIVGVLIQSEVKSRAPNS